jgi:hypothetical protein
MYNRVISMKFFNMNNHETFVVDFNKHLAILTFI